MLNLARPVGVSPPAGRVELSNLPLNEVSTLSHEIEFTGEEITGLDQDHNVQAVISYHVHEEKQTRHHPGGIFVDQFKVKKIEGCKEHLESQWKSMFIDYAQNHTEELIENAKRSYRDNQGEHEASKLRDQGGL